MQKCKILPPVQRTVQKKCKKIQNSATCAEDGAKKCKILPPVQRTVLLSEVGMGFSRSGFGIDIHSCLRTNNCVNIYPNKIKTTLVSIFSHLLGPFLGKRNCTSRRFEDDWLHSLCPSLQSAANILILSFSSKNGSSGLSCFQRFSKMTRCRR